MADSIDDELYTTRELAERMITTASPMLAGRKIYCPCDDFRSSEIVKALRERFNELRLEQLIASSYSPATLFTEEGGRVYVQTREGERVEERSTNCFGSDAWTYYRDSDVVVTNPPFSRLREFVGMLAKKSVDYFLIAPLTYLGTLQAAELIMHGKMFASEETRLVFFHSPSGGGGKQVANIFISSRKLWKSRPSPSLLDDYDFYDGTDIAVATTCSALPNYDGFIGAPITFAEAMPELYKIVGCKHNLFFRGRSVYARILIKKSKLQT